MDAMHDRPEAPFAEYDRVRLPDLHALHLLATDANTQLGPLGEMRWLCGGGEHGRRDGMAWHGVYVCM